MGAPRPKDGHDATPDDAPNRSAIVQVGAIRHGTTFDDRDRWCEHSSEKEENSEER